MFIGLFELVLFDALIYRQCAQAIFAQRTFANAVFFDDALKGVEMQIGAFHFRDDDVLKWYNWAAVRLSPWIRPSDAEIQGYFLVLLFVQQGDARVSDHQRRLQLRCCGCTYVLMQERCCYGQRFPRYP